MSSSGEYEYEEGESEYTDATASAEPTPKARPGAAVPVKAAKPSAHSESSDFESSQKETTAKLNAAVAQTRSQGAGNVAPQNTLKSAAPTLNNGKPAGPPKARKDSGNRVSEVDGDYSSEEEFTEEEEWESSEVPQQQPRVAAVVPRQQQPALARPPPPATAPPPPGSRELTDGDSSEEWESEGFTEESSVDTHDTGTLLRFLQDVCAKPALPTTVQRMYAADSVGRSAVARDLVIVTTPTRHCFTLLRHAVRSECAAKERFASAGSVYQDVLYHTLVRTGAVFFREMLSPTVNTVTGVTTELSGDQNQRKLQDIAGALFDTLFSKRATERAPASLRCALWVARDEARKATPTGDSLIAAFFASNIVARILANPVASKIVSSLTPTALNNMGRVAQLVAALVTPDATIGASLESWCSQQAPRLTKWLDETASDPNNKDWVGLAAPMAALPFKERDLVAKTMVEFANLKQRFTAGRDRCNADEQDLINVALKLLSTLASGVVGQSQTTVRSVRNPHRKVPHDIPELQREILGLEGFDLAGKGRRLFSQGPVVARKKTREEDGHLFLFSDILLYCKHNAPEEKSLFTFSRAYRLHQVTVRPLEEQDKAAVAAFCVSAFAQPWDYDLTLFAANARDRERWVELIRKKQDELRATLLKRAKRFLAFEVVKARPVPVELAVAPEVLMKLVPHTDNVIASYDFEQLCEIQKNGDVLSLDFNGSNSPRIDEAVLRVRSDKLEALYQDIQREKNSSQRSAREHVPSFRQLGKTPRIVATSVTAAAAASPGRTLAEPQPRAVEAVKQPATAATATRPPPPTTTAPALPATSTTTATTTTPALTTTTVAKAAPVVAVPPKDKGDLEPVVLDNRPGAPPDPLVVKDARTGKERDLWDPEKANRVKTRERSEARLQRRKARERRAELRADGNVERARRLDEDKTLFFESLERSLKRMVVLPDESAMRRPEELSDKEIFGLQKRAYKWKRENQLLRELLYTQYVCSHNRDASGPPASAFPPPQPGSDAASNAPGRRRRRHKQTPQ